VAGRFERYAEVSRQIHGIFHDFTPLVEGISLDEAFLDVTGATKLLGPAPTIATRIRDRVRAEVGISCSVGVARVKFLAKLASEAAKPVATRTGIQPGPGVVVIAPDAELDFLHPLPIEALWGVGPATAKRLRALGITTVGELARVPDETLTASLGRANGSHLARLGRAEDNRPVEPDRDVKSISHEETYSVDRRDEEGLRVEIIRMSDSVATRLRRSGLVGRTVTLKLRYGDFTTRTRSRTSPLPVGDGPVIAALAAALFGGFDLQGGIRLLGVGVSNLAPAVADGAEQMTLDLAAGARGDSGQATAGERATRMEEASQAVHAIRERFGDKAVGPAVLLGQDGLRVKRQGENQWGPSPPEPASGDQ
jgi:DNA polymerase-4